MVERRTMAVFTLYIVMLRCGERFSIFGMAIETIFRSLVFDWKCFPVINTAEPKKAIGKISAIDSEILWHYKVPSNQNQGDECDRGPKRP